MLLRSCIASSLLALGLSLSTSACATVHPYEREYLTRPGMDPHPDAMAAEFEAHVQSSREGAIGGRNTVESTGGGCGCN
jgi:hypothetical protein